MTYKLSEYFVENHGFTKGIMHNLSVKVDTIKESGRILYHVEQVMKLHDEYFKFVIAHRNGELKTLAELQRSLGCNERPTLTFMKMHPRYLFIKRKTKSLHFIPSEGFDEFVALMKKHHDYVPMQRRKKHAPVQGTHNDWKCDACHHTWPWWTVECKECIAERRRDARQKGQVRDDRTGALFI